MTVHEDVETDGLVSAGCGAASIATRDLLRLGPAAAPGDVAGAGATPAPDAPAPGVAGLMSRGLDSLFSAAVERVDAPAHDAAALARAGARAQRRHRGRGGARVPGDRRPLGLPLLVGTTDLRAALDRHTVFHDSHGGALAGLGLALAGGAGRVVLPSSDSARSFGPFGSSPALDGLQQRVGRGRARLHGAGPDGQGRRARRPAPRPASASEGLLPGGPARTTAAAAASA